jgi:hypothetical protein
VPITLPLKEMSIEEKIQTMELIWEDLCQQAEIFESPQWHQDILNQREAMLKAGDDAFLEWDEAKKKIMDSIS